MHPQMIKKRIFMKRMLRRPDFLWNKIRRRPDFLTKSFLSLFLPFSPSLTRAPSLSVMGLLTPLSLSLSLFLSRSRALSLSLSILCPVNAVKNLFYTNLSSPSPPCWILSTEILFQNFQIFHSILLKFANLRGGHFRKACRSRKK